MNTYYKLIWWFWWGWSRTSKVPKIAKFAKKEVRDEVDFLHGDKHQNDLQVDFNNLSDTIQSFLQGDTIIIDEHDERILKVLDVTNSQIFAIS